MYKRLFILIEGPDDGRFFQLIIKPLFEIKYSNVVIWEHASKSPQKTKNLINSINAMPSDYIFVTDMNSAPCITRRKEAKLSKLNNLNKDRIIVVIKEIESWYLAGLDDLHCKKYKIPSYKFTDGITKERFDSLIPRKFGGSRIEFLQEILKYFQVKTAKQKNKSFNYFLEKHV